MSNSAANELSKQYSDFISEYDHADELCKKVQLFRQEAGIPAINEIRYAGYHLRKSLDPKGQVSDTDQIRTARGHAQRASYEAAEAGIVLALKVINLFKEDYKKVIVTGDVKDYIAILSKCDEAQKRLGVKRESGDGQQLDHVKHRELFEFLSQAADTLHAARPEINKRMRETRNTNLKWIISTLVAVVLAIFAFFKDIILGLFR